MTPTCAAPGCTNPVVVTRTRGKGSDQVYCSPQCRGRMKNWRQRGQQREWCRLWRARKKLRDAAAPADADAERAAEGWEAAKAAAQAEARIEAAYAAAVAARVARGCRTRYAVVADTRTICGDPAVRLVREFKAKADAEALAATVKGSWVETWVDQEPEGKGMEDDDE